MADNVPGKRLGRIMPNGYGKVAISREDLDRPITKIDYTDDRARVRFTCDIRLSDDLMVKRGLRSPADATEKEVGPGEEPDRTPASRRADA